jgi:GTP-binding protein EngB required for normal cell division
VCCRNPRIHARLAAQELPSALPLPEIALTGRSNTGKSSLLNAMCGIKPGPGTASVAARPGWTKSIQFFEMCEAGCGDEVMVQFSAHGLCGPPGRIF